MDLLNFFWIFLTIASLTPIIQRRLLEVARARLIERIEKIRGTRVITLIHRQESIAFLGIPISRYIDIEDSEQVLRAIHLTPPDLPIDLIVHTPGGMVLATEQIAQALVRHQGKVTVFVPHYAMSGGTLLALAADEIAMDPNAVLGPVDPQLGEYPAISILSVIENKPIEHIDDRTLILADVARKAIRQVKSSVVHLLTANGMPEQKARDIAEVLASGRWTHDYPLDVNEAKPLGLPVTVGIPKEIYELMDLYRQTSQRRPSVEYIPMRYPSRSDGPGSN